MIRSILAKPTTTANLTSECRVYPTPPLRAASGIPLFWGAQGQWNSPVTARGGGQAELGAPSAQGVGAPAQRFGCPAQESRGFGVSAHAVRRFGAAQGGVGVVAAFGLTAQGFGAAPAAQRSHQSGPAAAGPAPQPSTVAAVLAEEW